MLTAEIERCARLGASGLGEPRPIDQGYDIGMSEGEALAGAAGDNDLFHVSEPVGHAYAGKAGLPLTDFAAFVEGHPGLRVISAHGDGVCRSTP